MVTHVVLMRFRNRDLDVAREVRRRLLAMQEKIPVLRALEVGIDVIRSDRAYDLALIARFDTIDDLHAYAEHPAHMEVLSYIRQVQDHIVSVDYVS
ncbi:stress responsive protein [Alicyclobacillus cellulosilyticus]|uniref:Stress responsive protein n=1 Tax=Alicyclobacillus cellulosilyticus TaxID=1003997 RepID=A0A917KHB5_9BACL|nr:Dabb family protein [Alicyclobacillus cellulosilyticus]GGJ13573.1 stress responsive protein [Alicyclobacillus cellulosilyticus]